MSKTATPTRSCAWCASAFTDPASRPSGRRVCDRCGVATTDPWPSDADLDIAYAGAYRPASGRFTGGGDALLRWSRARLAGRIDAVAPPGRVLDVGAGDGALVAAVRRRGRPAVGLERDGGAPGPSATPEPGEDDGTLDDVEGPFAAVVIWHVLEHLRAPGRTLERAAALLSPRGVLVVAVPNTESLQARAFGDEWFALDPPRHLAHIPASALLGRLRDVGLQIERVSHWRGGQVVFGWLHGLVARVPGAGDLYDAIRRPPARQREQPGGLRCGATLAAAVALAPVAMGAAAAEVVLRRGGSVYVEARRG
jgi:SAM-dependent methyltransferase